MTRANFTLPRRLAATAATLLLAGALGGCITLLPKAKPSQLYRFGASGSMPDGPPAPLEGRPGLLLEGVTFPREATSDGILTVTGDQAAYIAGSRWVSPAILLFTQAVQRAYDAHSQAVRVSVRGALGKTQGSVRVAVRDFQAEYRQGAAAPPTVVVSLHARITRSDGQVVAERDFRGEQAAADNRVTAIVPAFDAATNQALTQLVGWSDQSAAALADAPAVAIPARDPRVPRRT